MRDKVVPGASIFVVEDDLENRDLIERLLASQTYEVTSACSAEDALTQLDRCHPDLFLLDVGLPQMSGIELCRKLKRDARLRDIPVLFLTAFEDNRHIHDGFSAGGVDYLRKPFGSVELLSRISAHLRVHASLRALREAVGDLGGLDRERELLPVCASCGLVKTADGAWKSLQRYLTERLHLEFTHSICPGCEQRIYDRPKES